MHRLKGIGKSGGKSTINGVVKKVGDKDKGQTDGEAFLEIQSTKGIYVKGMVDEYQRKKLKVGSQISGTAYESGVSFEAEVKKIQSLSCFLKCIATVITALFRIILLLSY